MAENKRWEVWKFQNWNVVGTCPKGHSSILADVSPHLLGLFPFRLFTALVLRRMGGLAIRTLHSFSFHTFRIVLRSCSCRWRQANSSIRFLNHMTNPIWAISLRIYESTLVLYSFLSVADCPWHLSVYKSPQRWTHDADNPDFDFVPRWASALPCEDRKLWKILKWSFCHKLCVWIHTRYDASKTDRIRSSRFLQVVCFDSEGAFL